MKFEINITKKHLYIFAVLIALIGGGFAMASSYEDGDPYHSVLYTGEINKKGGGKIKVNSPLVLGGELDMKGNAFVCTSCIDSENIADGEVKEGNIADGAVSNDKLEKNAVGTDKIENGAVTSDKIAGGVDTSHLKDDAITSAKIKSNAVTSDKIKSNQVGDSELKGISISRYNNWEMNGGSGWDKGFCAGDNAHGSRSGGKGPYDMGEHDFCALAGFEQEGAKGDDIECNVLTSGNVHVDCRSTSAGHWYLEAHKDDGTVPGCRAVCFDFN